YWHEFFERFDVLLTPVAATAAFPHNHNPDRGERTVIVNGNSAPYAEQLFFAGLASLSYLPATAASRGLTGEGLPVRLQIIGPEGEDPTTIKFARLLAAEIGGFVPRPAYVYFGRTGQGQLVSHQVCSRAARYPSSKRANARFLASAIFMVRIPVRSERNW